MPEKPIVLVVIEKRYTTYPIISRLARIKWLFRPFILQMYLKPLAESKKVNVVFAALNDIKIKGDKLRIKKWVSFNSKDKFKELIPDYLNTLTTRAELKKLTTLKEYAREHKIPHNVSKAVGRICRDKLETYRVLKAAGVNHLHTKPLHKSTLRKVIKEFRDSGAMEVVTKPRKGSRGKNIEIHELHELAKEELEQYCDLKEAFVVQAIPPNVCLGGAEFKKRFFTVRINAVPLIKDKKVVNVSLSEPKLNFGEKYPLGKLKLSHIKGRSFNFSDGSAITLENAIGTEGGNKAEKQIKEQAKQAVEAIIKRAAKEEVPHNLLMAIEGTIGIRGGVPERFWFSMQRCVKMRGGEPEFMVMEVNARPLLQGYADWAKKVVVPKIEEEAQNHFKNK